jgi:transmembrane 9 superfamily protein 2/4
MAITKLVLAACWAMHASVSVSGHYMPGVKTLTFKEGEEVELKVNAITSIHTQIPKPYYNLPFCEPEGGPKMASENLGEFITGNKVQSSPYTINMLQEMYCQKVCQKTLDAGSARLLKSHILRAYHNNWIIDNLPSAAIGATEGKRQKHYAGGFPIGFVDSKAPVRTKGVKKEKRKARKKRLGLADVYVYNHVNIVLDYHKPADAKDEGYRVVGFSVEPMSIKHNFLGDYQWDGKSDDGWKKMLSTCTATEHMVRNNIQSNQVVASGEKILYTYDVTWKESDVAWSSRWDVYLNEEGLVPAEVHWYSITNSIFVVVFLSLLIISVLVKNLKNDIANYNTLAAELLDEEEDDDDEVDETGWKLVHADVFRPPSNFPMLYCVLVGSGTQLLISLFATICLAAVGFLNPSRRGSMMTCVLVLFMLFGIVAGYVSSRLYKAFRGRAWQLCTVCTAIFFPGLCFAVFLFFNTVLAFYKSSGSVPFLDILILAVMWCGVSIPLVFVGAFFGFKKEAMQFPTVTSTIARQIPQPSSLLLSPKVAIFYAGLIPFSGAYVELFFIMSSLWMDQYYYVFGFTFIVFLILLLTCAEVAVLLVYYQLLNENHRWWWFSLMCGGSVSFLFFGYSVVWFASLEGSRYLFTYALYFGYTFLMCFAIFLVCGSFSTLVCLWFVKKIFAAIKVD